MANDREFIIQPLISANRLVTLSDIDPTTSYAQIGVWQPNQQASGSPNNSYPSYAIPISEFASANFKNYLVVDYTYGDDTTAEPYNFNKPYSTIDGAFAVSADGDVIVVNPSSFSYVVSSNILDKTTTFYLYPETTVVFTQVATSKPDRSLKIYGEGNVIFNTVISADGKFNGDIIIECNELTLNLLSYLVPDPGFSLGSLFKIKAQKLTQNGEVGILTVYPFYFDIDVYTYYGNIFGPGSVGIADFWIAGISNGPTYSNKIKIVEAYVDHPANPGSVNANSAAFINVSAGTQSSTLFVEIDNLLISNPGTINTGSPFLLRLGPSTSNNYINIKKANLTNCNIIYDQGGTVSKVLLEGKYYVRNPLGGFLFIPLFIRDIILDCRADIIADLNSANSILDLGSTGSVDLINCKLIFTNTTGTEVTITKNGGAASTLRLKDVKLYGNSTTINGGTFGGEPVEIYSAVCNTTPVNTLYVIAPVILPTMTDNEF